VGRKTRKIEGKDKQCDERNNGEKNVQPERNPSTINLTKKKVKNKKSEPKKPEIHTKSKKGPGNNRSREQSSFSEKTLN